MILIKYPKINEKEISNYKIDNTNFIYFKFALIKERKKFVDKLKEYQNAGLIKWMNKPRNKYMQSELDDLVKKKKILKESLEQINKIFYN